MRRFAVALLLALAYLALTGNLEPANWVVAALVGGGIALLMHPDPGNTAGWDDLRRVPSVLWALLRYLGIMIVDVLRGGIQTARIVLDPSLPVRPGLIAIPSQTESDLATALSAHAITLSPGEMVIGIDEENTMYTHVLDAAHGPEFVAEAQRLRRELLSRIFA